MTDIGRDKSILNAEFELFLNFVAPPPTAVYEHGRGRGITRGRGRGGSNSVGAGGRTPKQAPKKYTLRDIPKFIVDSQVYKTMHNQWVHKQKIIQLNRPFRAAKKATDEENIDFTNKMHVVSSKMLNTKQLGKQTGKIMKLDVLQMRKALMMRGLLKSSMINVCKMLQ